SGQDEERRVDSAGDIRVDAPFRVTGKLVGIRIVGYHYHLNPMAIPRWDIGQPVDVVIDGGVATLRISVGARIPAGEAKHCNRYGEQPEHSSTHGFLLFGEVDLIV